MILGSLDCAPSSGVWSRFSDRKLVTPDLNLVSKYEPPTALAMAILRDGIIDSGETGADMIRRVATNLFQQEFRYDLDPALAKTLATEFIDLCDSRKIVMGTPILTNAGRHTDFPLSSCSEAASKTVNMPKSDPEDVYNVYLTAYNLGLCGITIYVDGSRKNQPKKLVQ